MKKFLLTSGLVLLGFIGSTFAENYFAFSHHLNAEEYSGLPFKFEATAKVIVEDSQSFASMYLRSDGIDQTKPSWHWLNGGISSREWQTYLLEGTIDQDAKNIVFGLFCREAGAFYFDNLIISVKNTNGTWKTIYQEGFENGIQDWKYGFLNNSEQGKNSYYLPVIDHSVSSKGNASLRIDATNLPGSNSRVGKYANVNGINLYYEIYGTGKPLVIIHGNGGSISAAGEHLDYFAQRYTVIAIDSRGQGKSIDDTTELTYELMASDISGLLDELNIDSTLIWGQSDGAILAIILALNHPDKVKKAVAFAANIVPDTTGIEAPIFRFIEKRAMTSDHPKEKQLMTLMWKHPNIADTILNSIKSEFLIMSGDRDFVPLSHTLDIFNNIPNAHLCVIPGATHAAAWEKPQLFQQIVVDFFEKPFTKPSTSEWFKE